MENSNQKEESNRIKASSHLEQEILNREGNLMDVASLKGKRILILTDLFPPEFAPRIYSTVSLFVEWGAECIVFTEAVNSYQRQAHGKIFSSFPDPCKVYRLNLRKNFSRGEAIRQILWQEKDILFAKEIEKSVRVEDFHLIFAFTFSLFPLPTAFSLAKKYNIPWIGDCRDIYEQYGKDIFLRRISPTIASLFHFPLRLLKSYLISRRTHYLSSATIVTTVSPWHREQLTKKNRGGAPQIYCLYNGYDEKLFYPRRVKNNRFQIIFMGRLLNLVMRNPSLLFKALSSSEMQSFLSSNDNFEIAWYVDENSKRLLQEMLKQYPLSVQRIQHFYSMIPFDKVADTLAQASIILLLANKEEKKGPHGMVSTKIFEALAMDKPILMIPGDGAISDMIVKYARAGIVADNENLVSQFIKDVYCSWKKNSYTCNKNADRDFIQQYTRKRMAMAFAQIAIKSLVSKKDIRAKIK